MRTQIDCNYLDAILPEIAIECYRRKCNYFIVRVDTGEVKYFKRYDSREYTRVFNRQVKVNKSLRVYRTEPMAGLIGYSLVNMYTAR